MNIADIVRVHAQRMPSHPALIEGREFLDWANLQTRIEAASWQLRERGVGARDVVALSLRAGIAQIVIALAASRLGAIACAMDWRARPVETAAVLALLQPRLFVAERTAIAPADVACTSLSEDWWRLPQGAASPAAIANLGDTAFLLLSSGTTGNPKAMRLGHAAAAWRATIRMHEVSTRCGMRVLQTIPLSSSAGLTGLLSQMLAGATTLFLPPLSSTSQIVEALQRERIDQVTLVPTAVRGMFDLATGSGVLLPHLAALVTLGAAFHAEEKQAALQRLTPTIYDHYGAAGAGAIAFASPAEMTSSPASVGRAALFTQIEIVDDSGRAQPTGAVGRIRVRTPTMATDYFGDAGSGERNEVFADGWAWPGDLGRLDERGLLYIEGRASSVIIRGGQNLYPEEIERVLLAHPAVAEAAVTGRSDRLLGEVPVALVVTRAPLDASELATHCRSALQPAKVPVEFRLVEALPKTANGKIRRAELARLIDKGA